MTQGREVSLGYYTTAVEAAVAYAKAFGAEQPVADTNESVTGVETGEAAGSGQAEATNALAQLYHDVPSLLQAARLSQYESLFIEEGVSVEQLNPPIITAPRVPLDDEDRLARHPAFAV